MKIGLLLSILLTISACGQIIKDFTTIPVSSVEDPRSFTESDSFFDDYVNEYEKLTGVSVNDVPINFIDDLQGSLAGVCKRWSYKGNIRWKEILIDKGYWAQMTALQKKNLIYHELGHCVKNLEHNQNLMQGNCPETLMYSSVINNTCLVNNWDYYEQGL